MLFRSAFLFIVIFLTLGVRSAEADPANIRILQRLLVWTGYYPGPIDGELGPGTIRAVRQLQLDYGEAPGGVPSKTVLNILIQKARQRQDQVDFRYGIEPLTGVGIGLPNRIVRKSGVGKHGALFTSNDVQVEVQTLKISAIERCC
jgi:serine protease Do